MHTAGLRRPSRYLALLIVGAVHVLAILALRIELAVDSRDEPLDDSDTPPLIVSFLERVEPSAPEPAPPIPLPLQLITPAPLADSSAIQLPMPAPPSETEPAPPPRGAVDWNMELKRSSQAMLDRAEEQARQDAPFSHRPEVPEALRPAPPGAREFAWSYKADRTKDGGIRISERCTLIMGIVPMCNLGKIPVRSDLLADMRKPKSPEELGVQHSKSLENVDRETRIRMEAVSRLLAQWRVSHGDYPDDLSELVSAPTPNISPPGRVLIVDTWDQKLIYKNPAHGSRCEYELYSIGPNGVDDHGARDDIVTCGSTRDIKF